MTCPDGTSGRPASRIIPRLDIKAPNLVKGIHLEGLRVMGDPAEHALRYYQDGADELLYVDIVASLYQRNSIVDLVEKTAAGIFVPLTVGGGIRSCGDIRTLLRAGAEKVSINTAAIRKPSLLTEASRVFGSQCIVSSIHRLHLLPLFDTIYVIKNGKVLEVGSFTDLKDKPGGALMKMWKQYLKHLPAEQGEKALS